MYHFSWSKDLARILPSSAQHENVTHPDLQPFGVVDQKDLNGAAAVGSEARREEKVPVGADSHAVGLEAAPAGGVVRDGAALRALQYHATLVVWREGEGQRDSMGIIDLHTTLNRLAASATPALINPN